MANMMCRVCGSTELEPITMLLNYPLSAGPVTQAPKKVLTGDMDVRLCQHCGTCTLVNAFADGVVYGDDYTSSCITYGDIKSVDRQTDCFVKFIGRVGKSPSSEVLEIGCYDGNLTSLLTKRYGFNMTGCEPCAPAVRVARENGCNVRLGVFNANDYGKLDMVVARNVLEHMASPDQFVEGVSSILKSNGTFVLEVPSGEHYIRSGILGTIVPQHPCYFGNGSLKRILGNHFLSVVTEENKATIRALASIPRRSRHTNETIADAMTLRAGESIRRIRYNAIRETVGNGKADIFGANTCALELISAGAVEVEQVSRVFDDDPYRWGKYLVNTGLVVLPRTAIGKWKHRTVIVCSYTHRKPIAEYITKSGNTAITLYREDE